MPKNSPASTDAPKASGTEYSATDGCTPAIRKRLPTSPITTPVIAVYSIFLAFGAAALCGLFFGTYPAARAAAMRPIDALRFE